MISSLILLLFIKLTLITSKSYSKSDIFTLISTSNALINRNEFYPVGCSFPDGSFALAWITQDPFSLEGDIFSQSFNRDNSPNTLVTKKLLISTLHYYSVVCLPNMNYIVMYQYGSSTIYSQIDKYGNIHNFDRAAITYRPIIEMTVQKDYNVIVGDASIPEYNLYSLDTDKNSMRLIYNGLIFDDRDKGIVYNDEIYLLHLESSPKTFKLTDIKLTGEVNYSVVFGIELNSSDLVRHTVLKDNCVILAYWVEGMTTIEGYVYSKDLSLKSTQTLASIAPGQSVNKIELQWLHNGGFVLVWTDSHGNVNFQTYDSQIEANGEINHYPDDDFNILVRSKTGFFLLFTNRMTGVSVGYFNDNGNVLHLDLSDDEDNLPLIVKTAFGIWGAITLFCMIKCVKKIKKMKKDCKKKEADFKKINIIKKKNEIETPRINTELETLPTEGNDIKEPESLRTMKSDKKFKTVRIPLHKA